MDKYQETFDTWNNLASLYQEKFMDLDLYNDTYDYVCNSIGKPKAKILEIACGPGNITKYLLSKRPDFDIFGIDIAANMIELARLNNPGAHFAVMDCRKINQLESKYDGIIGGFCLPYLSQTESEELISSSYDLVNDNGVIYLSFVAGDLKQSDFKVSKGGRVYFHYHNLDDIKANVNKAKFVELKTFELQYKVSETEFETHTILTAKKKNS